MMRIQWIAGRYYLLLRAERIIVLRSHSRWDPFSKFYSRQACANNLFVLRRIHLVLRSMLHTPAHICVATGRGKPIVEAKQSYSRTSQQLWKPSLLYSTSGPTHSFDHPISLRSSGSASSISRTMTHNIDLEKQGPRKPPETIQSYAEAVVEKQEIKSPLDCHFSQLAGYYWRRETTAWHRADSMTESMPVSEDDNSLPDLKVIGEGQ
jgi:hypothetical protein